MKTEPLSDVFVDGGLLVQPDHAGQSLHALDTGEVVQRFERHGVLLFRGFGIPATELPLFTDRFTELYQPDAVRRPVRFDKQVLRSVDAGHAAFNLHSEASFGATWPEIIWFYCHTPSTTGGSTTLCDGIRLWDALSPSTQARFLRQPLKYEIAFPLNKKNPGARNRPWPSSIPGVTGHIDQSEGMIVLTVLRYAVVESRLPVTRGRGLRRLCFANHLMTPHEKLITKLTMADGSAIEPEITAEIREKADQLVYDVKWEACDLTMVDNHRMLHGRRAFSADDPRDVLQVQTGRCNFAYGATTRGTTGREPEASTNE